MYIKYMQFALKQSLKQITHYEISDLWASFPNLIISKCIMFCRESFWTHIDIWCTINTVQLELKSKIEIMDLTPELNGKKSDDISK